VDAQLLDNNVLNFLFDRFFRHKICSVCVGRAWKSSGGCRTFPSTAWQVNELKRLSIIFGTNPGNPSTSWHSEPFGSAQDKLCRQWRGWGEPRRGRAGQRLREREVSQSNLWIVSRLLALTPGLEISPAFVFASVCHSSR